MDELETYTSTPIPTTRVFFMRLQITVQLFTSTRIVGRIVVVVASLSALAAPVGDGQESLSSSAPVPIRPTVPPSCSNSAW
jgi:hypothetical protein